MNAQTFSILRSLRSFNKADMHAIPCSLQVSQSGSRLFQAAVLAHLDRQNQTVVRKLVMAAKDESSVFDTAAIWWVSDKLVSLHAIVVFGCV